VDSRQPRRLFAGAFHAVAAGIHAGAGGRNGRQGRPAWQAERAVGGEVESRPIDGDNEITGFHVSNGDPTYLTAQIRRQPLKQSLLHVP